MRGWALRYMKGLGTIGDRDGFDGGYKAKALG